MTVLVNGQERRVQAGTSLEGLLASLDVPLSMVAVARNGEVVPRQEHARVQVEEGDRIEIVRMIGGG